MGKTSTNGVNSKHTTYTGLRLYKCSILYIKHTTHEPFNNVKEQGYVLVDQNPCFANGKEKIVPVGHNFKIKTPAYETQSNNNPHQ